MHVAEGESEYCPGSYALSALNYLPMESADKWRKVTVMVCSKAGQPTHWHLSYHCVLQRVKTRIWKRFAWCFLKIVMKKYRKRDLIIFNKPVSSLYGKLT